MSLDLGRYKDGLAHFTKLYQGHTKAFLAREIELHMEKLLRGDIDPDDIFEVGRLDALHELFRLLPCCADQRSCLTAGFVKLRVCATHLVRFEPGREAWRSWAPLGEREGGEV